MEETQLLLETMHLRQTAEQKYWLVFPLRYKHAPLSEPSPFVIKSKAEKQREV